jgi:ABC-type polysaccharide/polyol phosphate transport system ATPase subunit
VENTPQKPDGKPLLELRNLGIWYRMHAKDNQFFKTALLRWKLRQPVQKFWALRGIDLTCEEGQVLGIVGHNGAGKSTLCMALARILTPDEGEADVNGQVTPLLGLGSGFHPEMTGRGNIFLYAAFLGIPRAVIENKFEEILEFSELGRFIDEPLYTYSSGMKARLGFSVATMIEPEIMILDEVLAVGDRQFREKSRARIREMMKISKLIVVVSHAGEFIRRTCTHCLWLDHGQRRAYGETKEIMDQYEADPVAPAKTPDRA